MEEQILSLKEIGDLVARDESCVRAYLDRAEFNKYRFRTPKRKLRYKVTPELLDRLKELIYNRRCGDRTIG